MKLVSVNTGMPREVSWHGRMVTTAIFKEPATGRVALRKLNLDGDRQADLRSMGASTKRFTATRWRTTTPGRESCRDGNCRWACLEKTSRLGMAVPDCRKSPFIWATDFPSARRK